MFEAAQKSIVTAVDTQDIEITLKGISQEKCTDFYRYYTSQGEPVKFNEDYECELFWTITVGDDEEELSVKMEKDTVSIPAIGLTIGDSVRMSKPKLPNQYIRLNISVWERVGDEYNASAEKSSLLDTNTDDLFKFVISLDHLSKIYSGNATYDGSGTYRIYYDDLSTAVEEKIQLTYYRNDKARKPSDGTVVDGVQEVEDLSFYLHISIKAVD